MSEDVTNKKRKREVALEARITYHTPAKSFERLFNESSLEETKRVVRRKLGLADTVTIDLAQKRGNATLVLEDEDDFKAFTVTLKTTSVVELQVMVPNQDLQNPAPKKRKIKSLEQNGGRRESVLSDQAESQLGSSVSAIFPPPSESLSSAYRDTSGSLASPKSSPTPMASKPAEEAPPDKEPKKKEKRRSSKAITISVADMSPGAFTKAQQILDRHEHSAANKPPRARKKKEAKEGKATEGETKHQAKEGSTKITSVQALPATMDLLLSSESSRTSPDLFPSSKPKTNTKFDPSINKPSVPLILDNEKGKNKPKAVSSKKGQNDSGSKAEDSKATSSKVAKDVAPAQALCPICSEPFHLRLRCPLIKAGGDALDKRLEQLRLEGRHELVKDIGAYLENEQKREQLSMANGIKQSTSSKSVSKAASKKPQEKQGKQVKPDPSANPSGSGEKTVAGRSSHVPVQKPGEGSENSSDGSNNTEQLVDNDEDMEVWDEVGSVGSVPSGFLRPASQSVLAESPTRMPAQIRHSDSEPNTKSPSDTSEDTDASDPPINRNQLHINNKGKEKRSSRVIVKGSSSEESEDEEIDSDSTPPSPSRRKGPGQTNNLSRDAQLPNNDVMRTPHQKQTDTAKYMNTAPVARTLGNDLQRPAATGSSPLIPKAQSSQSTSWLGLPTLAGFRRGLSFKPSTPTNQLHLQKIEPVKEDERAISEEDSSSTSGSSDDSEDDARGKESKRLRTAQRASSGRIKNRDRLSQL